MPPRITTNLCGFFVYLSVGQLGRCKIKKVKTSLKGRKCKFLHCKHVLSIYNHELYCHVHLGLLAYDDKPKGMKAG
ncbi:MAG: hypothetical protein ACYDFR_01100 [Candidatus Omnitrophota bacterium]